MQRLTTLLLLAGLTFTSHAQSVDDYQPDSDGDGCIGMSDLLSLLSVFGSCEALPFACGESVSYQGYDYATVLIGEQCWFAENLRSENYENGDAIPSGLSDAAWANTLSGAVSVYGEGTSDCNNYSPDGDACDQTWSIQEYGRLYNWQAVNDARGLCPVGWHVPTDDEWTTVVNAVGGESIAAVAMKATYGWDVEGNGTNSSGFSALPGAQRCESGSFNYAGSYGRWWSSSPVASEAAWFRGMGYLEEHVTRANQNRSRGFSVRCIQTTDE